MVTNFFQFYFFRLDVHPSNFGVFEHSKCKFVRDRTGLLPLKKTHQKIRKQNRVGREKGVAAIRKKAKRAKLSLIKGMIRGEGARTKWKASEGRFSLYLVAEQ